MARLAGTQWDCHVCGDRRPDAKISVAEHAITDARGITVTQHVRYCNDRPMCERTAHFKNLTDLALAGASSKLADLQAAFDKISERLHFWVPMAIFFAFLLGFYIGVKL